MADHADDRDLSMQPTESLAIEARGVEAPTVESLHEENEVLRFLLGKTPSIKSDDTSSVTSTSSSSHSAHATSNDHCAGAEWSGQHHYACEREIPGAVDAPPPELEPICESSSEDDKANGFESPRKPSVCVNGFASQSMVSRVAQWARDLTAKPGSLVMNSVSTSPPETENPEQQSTQPNKTQPDQEDNNDTGVAVSIGLRQRRRSASMRNSAISTPTTEPRKTVQASSVWEGRIAEVSTHGDLIFVVAVLAILVGYCLAIAYRFLHPVTYPLPNVDALFKPWDVSNVSARFTSPVQDTPYTGAVPIEWEIVNFPADAIREGGVEPLEYRVLLDGRQIQFEVTYWSLPTEYTDSTLNKTFSHRLRPRDIDSLGRHELQLDVTFPIPGSDGEVRTLTETTTFTVEKPDTIEPILEIKSPVDGSVVTSKGSHTAILLEFEAHNVDRVDVILDKKSRLSLRNWKDGNLLLRSVSEGNHTITMEAFDKDGEMVLSQSTRIELRKDHRVPVEDSA